MSYCLLPGVIRFASRDIVRVQTPHGVQGFYRSSGKNSGMPDTWLPFDGVAYYKWFDKQRFVAKSESDELHRFGTQEMKAISEALGQIEIDTGVPFLYIINVNLWLASDQSLVHLNEQRLIDGELFDFKPVNWNKQEQLALPIYKKRFEKPGIDLNVKCGV